FTRPSTHHHLHSFPHDALPISFVSAAKSAAGSKPKTLSLKPFCPSALPWQPDELQPKRLNSGIRSFSKLNFRGRAESLIVTATLSVRPAASTRTSVAPSPAASTTPAAVTPATLGSR